MTTTAPTSIARTTTKGHSAYDIIRIHIHVIAIAECEYNTINGMGFINLVRDVRVFNTISTQCHNTKTGEKWIETITISDTVYADLNSATVAALKMYVDSEYSMRIISQNIRRLTPDFN